ncbi:MAG TPA: valine--tRNA ligase [Thermoflexales bacterium]|nr:valine--tRNA ligase [Thermoflexales bacterium]
MEQLAKTYDPKTVESRLAAWWEAEGYFRPEAQLHFDAAERPFVITIPPPNVTGTLHMGHALTSAIEDLMTRYHRMKGARTLYVPGTDHAGIATQAVVEKKLAKEGRNWREMSRSDFLEEVWDWKEKSLQIITNQQKVMGISADWTREAFTLDEPRSLAVRTAFKTLFDEGLIYRDTRMINWDPVQLTGVSDLEVETDEDGEAGHLWFVRYPLQTNRWEGPRHAWGSGQWAEGATEWITVATTRPETILGDTAVMVNPDDERYTHRIACRTILPVIGREVPIISDNAVDPAFGTGAVKVTPAHDFTDYDVGKRHHLNFVEVIDERAKMNENAGPYAGLDRFVCRKKLVADLEKEGLLVKVEDYVVRLGRGQRSGAVIEPRISPQWFCNMQAMAAQAADAVKNGSIRIVPERFEKTWFQWLDNIRDWCISRQLVWGHQIPVWYVIDPARREEAKPQGNFIPHPSTLAVTAAAAAGRPARYSALNEDAAYAAALTDWGDDVFLLQDTDVLDTWFSSGLWPFSTLGWPDIQHPDYKAWYPTRMLETGYDIIFFWVARMVMLGLKLTGQAPFDTVYLHGLIRSSDGAKMSKSKPDKVIDPLDLVSGYGTDALRFYLVTAGAPGNDIKMDARKVDGRWQSDRIEGARNFANKLWNAARYTLGRLETLADAPERGASLADSWIRARAAQTLVEVRRQMDDFQYGEAGKLLYDFAWNDFCDWYLELSKLQNSAETRRTLIEILDTILRALHPFMPYLTEEIWQKLKAASAGESQPASLRDFPALILAPYPPAVSPTAESANALDHIAAMQEAVRAIRNTRSERKVAPEKRVPARIAAGRHANAFEALRPAIAALASVDANALEIGEALGAPAEAAVTHALGEITVYLPLSGLVDLAAEKLRLTSELEALDKAILKSEALLASDFGARAPAAVIVKEKARQAEAITKRDQIRGRLTEM